MRLTPHTQDKLRYLSYLLIALVMAASGVLGWQLGKNAGASIRTELSERSEGAAAALDPLLVEQLSGTSADQNVPVYNTLKAQLANVKAANPDARSVYLMGSRGGRLFFFVDSEKPTSSQYSPAGDWYDDGTQADHAVFTNDKAFVEGPATDEYGTFFSGLAPIDKPGSQQVLTVLGIDFDASTYTRRVLYAAAAPVAVGLTLSMIIVIFEVIRRRNLQLLGLRSELVSVASHELRNPITGIRWASNSLQKMVADNQLAIKMANAIYKSAVKLQASTDDILELSHAMNQRKLNVTPVDMTQLMQEIIDTQMLSAQQKGVAITLTPSWPPQLLIDCDVDQIKRAMHNVVSNAVKYTKANSPVTIAYKDAGKMHQILVSDQGIGIPEAEQAKVWRGFYRASNAVASDIPGTGLGLYLVKEVFQRHRGSVSFTSVENQGTTFILNLPKHG
ncbi:MAG TPA: HAMP domain-containing sensor histidine kinase [Candidatus Saccharimonadales bacterium]|nr:HAMP domain-containing sensor histidine kinase [Candidatus Saccharimonadales bacterium]